MSIKNDKLTIFLLKYVDILSFIIYIIVKVDKMNIKRGGAIVFPNLNAEQARYKLTNQVMAEKLNLSRNTYETKKRTGNFSVNEAKKLCIFFKCSFDYLFETNY